MLQLAKKWSGRHTSQYPMPGESKQAIAFFQQVQKVSSSRPQPQPQPQYRAGAAVVDLESEETKAFARRARTQRHDEKSRRSSRIAGGQHKISPKITGNIELSDDDKDGDGVPGMDFPIGGTNNTDSVRCTTGSSGVGAPSAGMRRLVRNSDVTHAADSEQGYLHTRRAKYGPASDGQHRRISNRQRTPTEKALGSQNFNPEQVKRDRKRRDRTSVFDNDNEALTVNNDARGAKSTSVVIQDDDDRGVQTRSRAERESAPKSKCQRSPLRKGPGNLLDTEDEDDAKNRAEAAEEVKDLDAVDTPYTGPTHDIFKFPPRERGKITVTAEERERLRLGKYLNDSLIDFYLKLKEMELKDHPSSKKVKVKFFSSFFFGILRRSKPVDYPAVKSWTKDIDLFSTSLVFVPICDSYHWSLIIVANLNALEGALQHVEDNRREDVCSREEVLASTGIPRIIYLDSLDPKRGNEFGETMRHYLVEEWLCRKQGDDVKETLRRRVSIQFKSAIKILTPNVPIQTNEYDCGLYLMQSLKMFLHNTDGFATEMLRGKEDVYNDMYTQVDVQKLRVDIINLMDLYEYAWNKNGTAETDLETATALKILETTDVTASRYSPTRRDFGDIETVCIHHNPGKNRNDDTDLHEGDERGRNDNRARLSDPSEELSESRKVNNCGKQTSQPAAGVNAMREESDLVECTVIDKVEDQVKEVIAVDRMQDVEYLSPDDGRESRSMGENENKEKYVDASRGSCDMYETLQRDGTANKSDEDNMVNTPVAKRRKRTYQSDSEKRVEASRNGEIEMCDEDEREGTVHAGRKRKLEGFDKEGDSDGSSREMHKPAMGYGGVERDCLSFENEKDLDHGSMRELDRCDLDDAVEIADAVMEVERPKEDTVKVGGRSIQTQDLISGDREMIMTNLVEEGYSSSNDDEVEEVESGVKGVTEVELEEMIDAGRGA